MSILRPKIITSFGKDKGYRLFSPTSLYRFLNICYGILPRIGFQPKVGYRNHSIRISFTSKKIDAMPTTLTHTRVENFVPILNLVKYFNVANL